jgi:phosphohistidine phosphatase
VKRLGLLRHAKSAWDDVRLRDFDRGLNARGRKGAALMGRHIRERGEEWELIVASPAERVKLTLEASGLTAPVEWEQAVYLADAETLIGALQRLAGDPGSVLLVGHNPGLHELLFRLVASASETALFAEAAEKFPTAAYAVLELSIDRWADLAPGSATLLHFARPRDLDPQLGPEKR